MADCERSEGTNQVHGTVAVGFETVREAFVANFETRGELGAAFAATVDGAAVADLWGGTSDRQSKRSWHRDTLQVIFSGTKGLVAVCLLLLVDRGELDLDAPVRRYWPEFAAAGKGNVRVGELTAHQARLPGIRKPVGGDAILDDREMAALLASQPQEADGRARAVYHPLTYGWLCGELLRRVDGRSIGRFFAEEVAGPLGLDAWIGLPAAEERRVSTLYCAPDWGERDAWTDEMLASDELLNRVWNNPPLFPPEDLRWNRAGWHHAEIPGAGGIATARALARLYGCLSRGGEMDGVRLLSSATLDVGLRERERRCEPLLKEPQAFGVGFQLQTDRHVFGPPADAFGHAGAGGSVHGAWPNRGVGFSYAMNLMRDDDPDGDPRARALLTALYDSVEGTR